MEKKMKHTLLLSAIVASTLTTSMAFAAGSANVGVGSNYIWRGVTQSGDDAAISGGLDYDFDNGFSVGTWTSSLGGGNSYELDLYGAYSGTVGGLDYGLSLTNYRYPTATNADFTEVGGSLGLGPVALGVAYTIDSDDNTGAEFSKGDIYYSLGVSKEIKKGLSIGAVVGSYDFDDNAGNDYTHYQLSLSKSDFTFAVEDNDLSGTAGDPRVTVSWSKSFDL
jgi:uncharacterized protein (TIGR02001 family)